MGWLGLGAASLARRSRRGAPPAISAIAVPALGGLADGGQVQSGLSAGALDTANYAGTDGAITSVAASVTINGAAGALADMVSAGDTVSVVITVEDDAGNSRAFFAGAQVVAGVAPTITASDSLSGRTLTITADNVTGSPGPSVTLVDLTLDGADALADATGTGPWSYVVPDSAASQTVAWQVDASNLEGTASASGSEVVAGNSQGTSLQRESDGTVTVLTLETPWTPTLTREPDGTVTVEAA